MPAIPDRWIPYKACGNVIEGTRFICFKVPLKKSVQTRSRGINNIWDIPAVLNEIPKLGAVIDLTNTARYYNPMEFLAAGVQHRKILMPGRIIPPENKVTEFMEAIETFLEIDEESLIGIHCTHGLNRTGYMVCRYMRDRLGVPAKDAIKRFEIARGYRIERDNYIADLLGLSPPEPDIGSDTNITPLNDQFLSNSSSSNNKYSTESCGSSSRSNNWRDREVKGSNWRSKETNERNERSRDKGSKWRNKETNERNERSRDKESNWRSRETNERSRSRESLERTKSNSDSSDFSYDFRYDY